MESEVVKGNNDVHLQKPPKIQQKEKEAADSSLQEIQILNDCSSKPQSPAAGMEGYDPNRIPASVFSSKGGGAEWSAASNDSLFSIQMGNNSFSNDYAIMYGTGKSSDFDLNNNPQLKSGELPRLDDYEPTNNNNQYVYVAATPGNSSSDHLAPVMEQDEGSVQSADSSSRVDKKDGSPYINYSPPHAHAAATGAESDASVSFRPLVSPPAANPRISDVSGHSNRSFAFPVLTSDSGTKERSVKVGPEKEGTSSQQAPAPVQAEAQPPPQKPNKWFSCFFCPRCC